MNKKRILRSILSLAFLATISLVLIYFSKTSGDKTPIVITYPGDIKDLDVLGNILPDDFYNKKKTPYNVIVNDSSYYLDDLKIILNNKNKSDIYYVVNNRTINSPEITNPAYDFDIKDRSFKNIPESFKSFSRVNNSFTYVPLTWAPWGIYYNKKVFKELNLKEPETFSQLEGICSKISSMNKIPFSMIQELKWPFTSWFDYISIRKYGAGFHNNLLSGRVDFTSEEAKSIFLTLFELINRKWFYKTNSDDWTLIVKTLIDGDTVMALSSTFYYTNIPEDEKENIGWFSFPVINPEFNDEIVTSAGFITSEVSANITGVKDFYKYISNDGQKIINRYTGFNPIHKRIIKNTGRKDLSEGYDKAIVSDNLIPSFERNNHPQLIIPLKNVINKLFYVETEEDILQLLVELEVIRLQI